MVARGYPERTESRDYGGSIGDAAGGEDKKYSLITLRKPLSDGDGRFIGQEPSRRLSKYIRITPTNGRESFGKLREFSEGCSRNPEPVGD